MDDVVFIQKLLKKDELKLVKVSSLMQSGCGQKNVQPHCSYRISSTDPPVFDRPSITVDDPSHSATQSHSVVWQFIKLHLAKEEWVIKWHIFVISWFWSMSVTQRRQNSSRSFCGYFAKLSKRPVSLCKRCTMQTLKHTHTQTNAFKCSQNNNFHDNLTFFSRLERHKINLCKHLIPASQVLLFVCVCVSMSGAAQWMSLLGGRINHL